MFAVMPASAGLIFANNAGSSIATAEDLTAADPTEIVGALSGDPNDVAIFQIFIWEPLNFSAMTVDAGAFGIPDTVLSLFDSTGVGIYLNDDISGGNTLSCISTISQVTNPCPTSGAPLPVGKYYLAISESANYPIDGFSNEIFMPTLSTDLASAVSTNPLAGWDGNSFTSPDTDLVNYDIVLTGTTPEPGTWLLTAGGIGVLLVAARRRRRAAIGSGANR
jgi:PEP-CTERM motif